MRTMRLSRGGFSFDKWVAIEGGYANLGKYRIDLTSLGVMYRW